jgi:hypothetical protein
MINNQNFNLLPLAKANDIKEMTEDMTEDMIKFPFQGFKRVGAENFFTTYGGIEPRTLRSSI